MIERVKKLKIKNFRGFKGEHIFNLDADIILLSGKNGVGKSTMIYALDRLLNGYSKNGILSKIGNNITSVGSDSPFTIQINEENALSKEEEFFISKDDTYSRLYELGSIFYQEYFNDIGLEDILKILSGDLSTMQFKPLLNNIRDSFIPQLKSVYLPSTIDVFERRREFFTKWKEIIEELKKYEQFKDIKQNFLFDNKGTPNLIESQFYNFLIDRSKKLNVDKNYENIDKNDFLEILRNIRDFFDEFSSKTDQVSTSNETDFWKNLYKYINHRVERYDGKLNIFAEELKIYLIPDDKQLEFLELELNNRKTVLEKLNKEIEKIEKSLKKWSILGQPSFEEILNALPLYANSMNDLKDVYYPTEVVLWLKNISKNIEKITEVFNLWYEKLRKLKEQKEKEKDSLKLEVSFITELIDFNKSIAKLNLKNKIIDKLSKTGSVLLKDILTGNIQEQKKALKDIVLEIIDILNSQIEKENRLKEEVSSQKKYKNQNKIEKIIEYTEKVIRKENGTNAVLLAITNTIPEQKLKELTYTLNSILRFFHFPHEFLDIKIINSGTKKKPKYIFATSKGKKLNYSNLSTGQKSQLAIAWTIGLNYLLSNKLPHKVIMFDDVTTSLDLAQLIPSSLLFRKMAYSDSNNRQVIISSHHDDLTNRFVDFLMPPPGKKFKVIYFEDWTFENGPKYKEYMVKSNDNDNNWLNTDFYKKKIKELKNYLEGNYEL